MTPASMRQSRHYLTCQARVPVPAGMTAIPLDASRRIVVNERRCAGCRRRWLATGHRRFVVVSGSAEWARTSVIQWSMIARRRSRRSAVSSLTGISGRRPDSSASRSSRGMPRVAEWKSEAGADDKEVLPCDSLIEHGCGHAEVRRMGRIGGLNEYGTTLSARPGREGTGPGRRGSARGCLEVGFDDIRLLVSRAAADAGGRTAHRRACCVQR